MLNITFRPESENFFQASREYQAIWMQEGNKIAGAMEQISELKFVEKHINAMVFEGISRSHPLMLRASYPLNVKKATLIHELCHILVSGNIGSERKMSTLENHKIIYLILYDIWTQLYGENFAGEQVKIESKRTPIYREAWEWALSKSQEERQHEFKSQLW